MFARNLEAAYAHGWMTILLGLDVEAPHGTPYLEDYVSGLVDSLMEDFPGTMIGY